MMDLAKKTTTPQQVRAQKTYERILGVAAEVLAEVGLDGLTTNLVCKRAGLTPPTLYRYFHDKYDLLAVLGHRLMDAQNQVLLEWATPETLRQPAPDLGRSVLDLFARVLTITQAYPGGVSITRAVQAVPALHGVVLESHRSMATSLATVCRETFPQAPPERVRAMTRVAIQCAYSLMEMLFDEPDQPVELVGEGLARVVVALVDDLRP